MANFDARTLARLAEVEEVEVETGRGRRTTIWIVVADEQAYVRSIRGSAGIWYRELRRSGRGVLRVGRSRIPVRVIAARGAATLERVSAAFRAKYRSSPYVSSVLKPETLAGTLRLEPA